VEEQAGMRFFTRSTRNVELTAEGQVFESIAAQLLNDFEQAFNQLEDHAQRRQGRVSIAALPSVAGGALPSILAEFHAQHPRIEIILKDVTADVCLELVRKSEADFALSAAIAPGPDFTSEALLSDTFHLVCREDHALAKKKRLGTRDILSLPMIKFARTSSIRQHLDAALYPTQPPTLMEVYNLVTAAGLIAHGMGVTLVPTLALFQFNAAGLVAIPVTLPIKDRDICLIQRKDASESIAAQTFITLLRKRWGK
jgi:DNA-binding transcriptional LysR family regulator